MNEAQDTPCRSTVDPQQVRHYLTTHHHDFPAATRAVLQAELEQLTDAQFAAVTAQRPKDPAAMRLISVLLGWLGIDRFLLGQIGPALFKLFTCGLFGVLYILDWFLIGKAARMVNFDTLYTASRIARHAPDAFVLPESGRAVWRHA